MFCQAWPVCFNKEQTNDNKASNQSKLLKIKTWKLWKHCRPWKLLNKEWQNFMGQIIWLHNLQNPSFVKHDHCATIVSKPMTTKRQINQNYWRSRCKRYENVVGRKYCLQKKWQRQLTSIFVLHYYEVFTILEFFSFILQDYSVNLDLLKETKVPAHYLELIL